MQWWTVSRVVSCCRGFVHGYIMKGWSCDMPGIAVQMMSGRLTRLRLVDSLPLLKGFSHIDTIVTTFLFPFGFPVSLGGIDLKIFMHALMCV